MTRRMLIAGGGTGGHVYPGLALAEALTRAAGIEMHWAGTVDRVEAHAVPRAGLPLHTLDVAYLKGRRGLDRVGAVARLPKAGVQALAILARVRPEAVIGVGGFASGPVAAAAAATGTPVFLLEQNATPGATNRALARVARTVYASLEASRGQFPRGCVVLGNPVRRALVEGFERVPRAEGEPVRLLVLGGSQGARSLNEGMPALVRRLADAGRAVTVRHAAGRGRDEVVRNAYADADVHASVDAYIDDMRDAYAHADLVITRAGATTIAELTALGLPAMYVPFPHAADDHQTANARAVVEAGGGVMVTDDELLSGERPARILVPLLQHDEVLARMGRAAGQLGHPDAADRIAEHLLQTLEAA